MASGPNPIELYEAAVAQMLPTMAAIKADQLSSSTPCTEWNVQALLNHNLKVAAFANGVLNGQVGDPGDMFSVAEPLPTEGAEAVFQANTAAVLATAKSMDMTSTVSTPFGDMPAGGFLMIPFGDLVVHKWDLSKATGQNTDMDSALAEVCFGVLTQAAEGARAAGFFGPEVQISMTGSMQDKVLGITGRTP